MLGLLYCTLSHFTYHTCFLPAGVCLAQPCRYCFYSVVQKWGFRPAGATRSPDKREIWHGERTGKGPLPRAKFHDYRGRNVGTQPPKLSKFRILAINLYFRGDSFATFHRNVVVIHLQACYIYLSIRLHHAFLFKYNNNKNLRTCKYP